MLPALRKHALHRSRRSCFPRAGSMPHGSCEVLPPSWSSPGGHAMVARPFRAWDWASTETPPGGRTSLANENLCGRSQFVRPPGGSLVTTAFPQGLKLLATIARPPGEEKDERQKTPHPPPQSLRGLLPDLKAERGEGGHHPPQSPATYLPLTTTLTRKFRAPHSPKTPKIGRDFVILLVWGTRTNSSSPAGSAPRGTPNRSPPALASPPPSSTSSPETREPPASSPPTRPSPPTAPASSPSSSRPPSPRASSPPSTTPPAPPRSAAPPRPSPASSASWPPPASPRPTPRRPDTQARPRSPPPRRKRTATPQPRPAIHRMTWPVGARVFSTVVLNWSNPFRPIRPKVPCFPSSTAGWS